MYFLEMNSWNTTIMCFQMAKNAWREERKKHLLTETEIETIDRTFFEMEQLIFIYDYSQAQFNRLFYKLEDLMRLIHQAELKMGYVPLRIFF